MSDTIKITGEYGVFIRKAALAVKKIAYSALLDAFEVEVPLAENDDLVSFGPSFGQEAMDEFVSRLQALGLEYFDDFFCIASDFPEWCALRVGLAK